MIRAADIRTLVGALLVFFCCLRSIGAQANEIGAWEPPFSHHATFVAAQTTIGGPEAVGTNLLSQPPQVLRKIINAIHMSLIPTGPNAGRVVVWDDEPTVPTPPPLPQRWSIVDPGDWLATPPVAPVFENDILPITGGGFLYMGQILSGDLFCGGHALNADGRLIVAGGTSIYPQPDGTNYHGATLMYAFDPRYSGNAAWCRMPDLDRNRFCPSVVILGNGQVLVLGGTDDEASNNASRTTYEAFSVTCFDSAIPPVTSTWDLDAQGNRSFAVTGTGALANYPRTILLQTGQLFRAGYAAASKRITHIPGSAPQIVMQSGWQSAFGTRTYGGAEIMPRRQSYPTDVVLVAGGQSNPADPLNPGYQQVPCETELCTLPSTAGATGTWTLGPSMKWKRRGHNMVIWPDGRIMSIGRRQNPNGTGGNPTQASAPVHEPEVFDGKTWAALATHEGAREYHSTALLLLDGRILAGGGNTRTWDYQIYDPPYLFSGPRPIVTDVPGEMHYGMESKTGCDDSVQRVTLIRAGSVTHHCDCSQRLLELDIVTRGEGSLGVMLPSNAESLPPGWYMLFALSERGVPSIGRFVRVS